MGAVNDPPVANDDSYSTDEDTTLNVAAPGVLGNDSDPEGDTLTAIKVTDPSHGSLTLNSDGSFSYTPDADFSGSDSFTYKANDGSLDSNIATVTITVGAINGINLYLCSPADMVVTDPDGLTISKELNEIPGATYTEIDINADGDLDDVVNIPDRKIGDYLINVVPEPDASPTDTYTLEVSAAGVTIVLAENVQIADIPAEGYIVRSTETVIIQIIPATIDFDPDVLNLRSKGRYVTAYIELPMGYDISQIDISSIGLNSIVPALIMPSDVGDHDHDGIPDLMVKFDRSAVQGVVETGGTLEITVTGEIEGMQFEGIDTIRVIDLGPPLRGRLRPTAPFIL